MNLARLSLAARCELLLFVATLFAFAYFNQGGGWNQNARFAEVRAIVEEGRFAIDHYLVYQRDPATQELVRCPLDRAEYQWQGQRHRLCWVDMDWNLEPVGPHPLEGAQKAAMVEKCSSGDIGYVPETGHFHPNKPPGTSFVAVPGYFVLYHVERLFGVNPDHWWWLDVNMWLTGVFSVGVSAALGCVLFFRLARELGGGALLPALLATLAFAFGTTFFPFATIFFDHALTAALLVAAFYFLRRAREERALSRAVLAGICAGLAVLTNYVAVGAVAMLGLYAVSVRRGAGAGTFWQRLQWGVCFRFCLGGFGPAVLLLLYGYLCYGSPFRPSTDFQNPLFQNTGAFLGMFQMPRNSADLGRLQYVAALLLWSPFRGVFWFCPVLLLSLWGFFRWLRGGQLAPEARLCAGIFLFFFGVNVLFNGYHAGFTAGPRYLVPGLPFLALPLVAVFTAPVGRWLGGTLGGLSILLQLVLTATDAQNPVGVGGHARVELRRSDFTYDLLGEYALPLFFHGRAWPLLEQQLQVQLDKAEAQYDEEELPPGERLARRAEMAAQMRQGILRGEPSPFLLAAITGPVSVNPIGAFEGLLTFGFYPPGSPQTVWASFNVGELLAPPLQQSRWSLLPLLLITGGLCAWAILLARREKQLSPVEATTTLPPVD